MPRGWGRVAPHPPPGFPGSCMRCPTASGASHRSRRTRHRTRETKKGGGANRGKGPFLRSTGSCSRHGRASRTSSVRTRSRTSADFGSVPGLSPPPESSSVHTQFRLPVVGKQAAEALLRWCAQELRTHGPEEARGRATGDASCSSSHAGGGPACLIREARRRNHNNKRSLSTTASSASAVPRAGGGRSSSCTSAPELLLAGSTSSGAIAPSRPRRRGVRRWAPSTVDQASPAAATEHGRREGEGQQQPPLAPPPPPVIVSLLRWFFRCLRQVWATAGDRGRDHRRDAEVVDDDEDDGPWTAWELLTVGGI